MNQSFTGSEMLTNYSMRHLELLTLTFEIELGWIEPALFLQENTLSIATVPMTFWEISKMALT